MDDIFTSHNLHSLHCHMAMNWQVNVAVRAFTRSTRESSSNCVLAYVCCGLLLLAVAVNNHKAAVALIPVAIRSRSVRGS